MNVTDELAALESTRAAYEIERRVMEALAARPRVPERGALAPRSDRAAPAPMSFAQERLWFLEQTGQAGAAYHQCGSVRLQGELDVPALERSLSEVVRRHEILRTGFEMREGCGIQRVRPPMDVLLPVVDLSSLAAPEQEREILAHKERQAIERFDLGSGALLRGELLRVSPRDHVLLIAMHHLISDGWSIDVMHREIGALYTAYVKGETARLEPLPVQYADYAIWQREWLQGTVLDEQLSYWRERLQGAPAQLELPTDRPRPSRPTFKGGAVNFEIPAAQTQGLQELARREGVTLFMVLMAAYQVLLSRWSGQEDVVVGTPIAGRRQRQVEGLVGLFVNTLALRTDVSGDPTFQQLLGRVQEAALEAYAHQDLPFEKLVQELQPERTLSHQPIFQVWMVLEDTRQRVMALPGLMVSPARNEHVTTQFDLSLHLIADQAGITAAFEYALDLFDLGTVQRMTEHFRNLLTAIVADPGQRISQLPMIGREELERQLLEWNRTEVSFPAGHCVHELISEQARRTPKAIAVKCGSQTLTYGELERRSNQLAQRLAAIGVGPDVVVGVYLERSFDMVIALLGILKAGGGYLPLDPGYPPERLSYMLQDAQVPVVVTQTALEESLPSVWSRVVKLDDPGLTRQPAEPPALRSDPGALAYVIYTSGSSGLPKGVMVEHRALLNHMQWMLASQKFDESDVVLQKTPLSFDASVWEVFAPLMVGGRLVMARPDGHQDVGYLRRVTVEEGVTVLQLVPSMLGALLQECREQDVTQTPSPERAQPERRPFVKRLYCGGEALTSTLRDAAFRLLAPESLINLYGPTETCIQSVVHACRSQEATVPIGRPIANVALYVLDENLQAVPVGACGELHVGGAALARGYLNRPGLTAKRFIASPFHHGERLYRTGDRVRYRADGALEYVGRLDQQVKLNGYRLEPGEVEAALERVSQVRRAAVGVQDDAAGHARLVAWVVMSESATLEPELLRQQLAKQLPLQMIPTAFVSLAEMPRLPNGKIDRASLRDNAITSERRSQRVAPETELEKALARIWSEVLERDDIGVTDGFFDLGGHSLLMTRVIARVEEAFQIELTLRTLFEARTVRELAAWLEAEIAYRTREREARLREAIANISDEEVAARLRTYRETVS